MWLSTLHTSSAPSQSSVPTCSPSTATGACSTALTGHQWRLMRTTRRRGSRPTWPASGTAATPTWSRSRAAGSTASGLNSSRLTCSSRGQSQLRPFSLSHHSGKFCATTARSTPRCCRTPRGVQWKRTPWRSQSAGKPTLTAGTLSATQPFPSSRSSLAPTGQNATWEGSSSPASPERGPRTTGPLPAARASDRPCRACNLAAADSS
mmetsp:Transcript_22528/g.64907  ORF Transcript_22528/g.64907 Transcript_22528/m.64907 type:complete len:207 (+) Transcript_22528:326-946(+)